MLQIAELKNTVMILSFRTDMPGQTVQPQIRLLLIWIYTVCHSVCIVWTHYSMVEPHSLNFRVIVTNFLGVRIFRKFTVKQQFVAFYFILRIQSSKSLKALSLFPICLLVTLNVVFHYNYNSFCNSGDYKLLSYDVASERVIFTLATHFR